MCMLVVTCFWHFHQQPCLRGFPSVVDIESQNSILYIIAIWGGIKNPTRKSSMTWEYRRFSPWASLCDWRQLQTGRSEGLVSPQRRRQNTDSCSLWSMSFQGPGHVDGFDFSSQTAGACWLLSPSFDSGVIIPNNSLLLWSFIDANESPSWRDSWGVLHWVPWISAFILGGETKATRTYALLLMHTDTSVHLTVKGIKRCMLKEHMGPEAHRSQGIQAYGWEAGRGADACLLEVGKCQILLAWVLELRTYQ